MSYDRYRHQVSSLLLLEGANDSTAIADETGRLWTAYGNAKLSTAQYPYGASSLRVSSGGDYVETAHSGLDELGSGPFTLDLHAYMSVAPTGAGKYGFLYCKDDVAGVRGPRLLVNGDLSNKLRFTLNSNNATLKSVDSIAAFPTATWRHIRVVRTLTTLYLFIHGVLQGTVDVTGVAQQATAGVPTRLGIARNSSGGSIVATQFNGYIKGYRLTPGVARSTADFTPPSEPYSLRGTIVSGVTSKGSPAAAVSRKVLLMRTSDLVIVGTGISDSGDGAYSIETDADVGEPIMGIAYPDYGAPWAASAAVGLGQHAFPLAAPNSHWYEAEQAGTSAGTEPTWPTDGSTVADGTVVWRDKGVMERPWAEGPYVAEAA